MQCVTNFDRNFEVDQFKFESNQLVNDAQAD